MCDYNVRGFYYKDNVDSQVTLYINKFEFEKNTKLDSSEKINKNMTHDDLKRAAEMFVYLNVCPGTAWHDWFNFYKDIFLKQTPQQMVLTLNRMMKKNIDKSIQEVNEELLNKISVLFPLQYKEIQNLLLMQGGNSSFSLDNSRLSFASTGGII